jgi:molybdopterin converting factor small subunit
MASSTGSPLQVTVHLHTVLQRGSKSQIQQELPAGATVGSLLDLFEIEMPLEALLLVVNGRHAEPEQTLQDGDEVHFIPALEGG